MGVSTVLFSFLNWMHNKDLIISVCLIVRIIEGISSGFIYCAVYSVIAIVFKERQVEYLSYVATAEAVTMILGPAIGSFLYELFGFQTVFLIVASFDFIVALVVIFMVPKEVDINDRSLESTSEQNSIAVIYNQANNLINQQS